MSSFPATTAKKEKHGFVCVRLGVEHGKSVFFFSGEAGQGTGDVNLALTLSYVLITNTVHTRWRERRRLRASERRGGWREESAREREGPMMT